MEEEVEEEVEEEEDDGISRSAASTKSASGKPVSHSL